MEKIATFWSKILREHQKDSLNKFLNRLEKKYPYNGIFEEIFEWIPGEELLLEDFFLISGKIPKRY